MEKEQLIKFLTDAPEEYIKVYEDRFKKVAKKAFIDGCYNMAALIDNDGDYQLEWADPETFRTIKLANDIDNAAGQPMTLNQYQRAAMKTCLPSCDNFSYMMLNLVGEVGEFASKVAKEIRRGNIEIGATAMPNKIMPYMNEDEWWAKETELMMEAGDILWQLAGLCTTMGWTLEEIAQRNLDKLSSRKKRGVIDGDGDNR